MARNTRSKPKRARTAFDGFQNLITRMGVGAGSVADGNDYNIGRPITREPRTLEWMYRGSWIVGAAVDSVAEDMTRAGLDFGSAVDPDVIDVMTNGADALQIWSQICDGIRWGRLFGGSIVVKMIDGQDMATKLDPETVGKGQFKGLVVMDRWCLVPTITDTVTEMGPDLGKPLWYVVGPNAPALVGKKIHYSRVERFEGEPLPYFQRRAEQGWGLSVVERMYDRLTAFDSATVGAAQLVFKAYLRTLKVEGLKKILAAGGDAVAALAKQVEGIRQFQTNEGLTLIDAADTFETQSYTFAGLDQILLQFGQQLSGATQIPLVRLFGQSPAGLNSTGESDLRNYYDGINAKQEAMLRGPMGRILDLLHRSETGEAPPEGFSFKFNPLWQTSDEQKANIAKTIAETVAGAMDAGIIEKPTALRELKQAADVTGVFSNIEEADIEAAENAPPEIGELASQPELKPENDLLGPLHGSGDGA